MTAHELHHLFYDEFHVCGCGAPESTAVLIRDLLAVTPFYDNQEKLKNILPTDGILYLVLGWMTELDLLEHGGGIGGSWITPRGQAVLEALNREIAINPDLDQVFDSEYQEGCPKCA